MEGYKIWCKNICTPGLSQNLHFLIKILRVQVHAVSFIYKLTGNMHHKYDVGSKDEFYIIDIAAFFLVENLVS